MERITSRTNPTVAHIRKLISSKDYRRKMGETVCEGPKMLREALCWKASITAVVFSEEAEIMENLPETARQVSVPADLLRWISDTQTPQRLLFTVRLPGAETVKAPRGERFLVLDGMQDPGNLGTIWRTADAFGADGLILLGQCADPWGPKTLRATMGACFRFPVWEMTLTALQECLEANRLPLYATALREDTVALQSVSLAKAAVVIGSEGRGVSREVLKACGQALKIPMRERCESLNAAVAASVVLWEMTKETLNH